MQSLVAFSECQQGAVEGHTDKSQSFCSSSTGPSPTSHSPVSLEGTPHCRSSPDPDSFPRVSVPHKSAPLVQESQVIQKTTTAGPRVSPPAGSARGASSRKRGGAGETGLWEGKLVMERGSVSFWCGAVGKNRSLQACPGRCVTVFNYPIKTYTRDKRD